MAPGVHQGLTLDGSDWYHLELPAGRRVRVRVRAQADVEEWIEMDLTDLEGRPLARQTREYLNPREALVCTSARGGPALLHVRRPGRGGYQLELTHEEAGGDRLEPNDLPGEARALELSAEGQRVERGLTLGGEVDGQDHARAVYTISVLAPRSMSPPEERSCGRTRRKRLEPSSR